MRGKVAKMLRKRARTERVYVVQRNGKPMRLNPAVVYKRLKRVWRTDTSQ